MAEQRPRKGAGAAAGTEETPRSVPHSEQRFTVALEDLECPKVAVPTLLVFVFAYALFFATLYARTVLRASPWLTVPLQAYSIFLLFTPMHDAAHMSLAPSFKALNWAVGWACSLAFMAPFPAFRWVHLQHHKHTNDPKLDPDMWSATGPRLLLPLRWMCQELHYYVSYLSNYNAHPPLHLYSTVTAVVLFWGAIVLTACFGPFYELVLAWLLPLRLAVAFLAYTFDYVPHKPHAAPRQQSLYKTTSKIQALWAVEPEEWRHSAGRWWLRVLLLGQDDHAVHHCYPQLPWYLYRRLWAKQEYREKFVQAGTGVASVYRSETPWW